VSSNQRQRIPSWAFWVIGAVTLLAIAVLVLAVVLGVRAGQQQVDIHRRQQVGIALQQAIDFRTEGNLEAALDAYQRVLALEPGNPTAVAGIENLLQVASSGEGLPTATATPAAPSGDGALRVPAPIVDAATGATPTLPSTGPAGNLAGLLRAAQADFDAGRWEQAVNQLISLRQADPTYELAQVNALLFDAYVNLATERDNADKLEEALAFYERALELDPANTTIQRERDLLATYLDVLTNTGADWAQTVALLQTLYAEEPGYRDVAQRLPEALVDYGDLLAETVDTCLAAQQFTAALELSVAPGLIVKRDETQQLCDAGGGIAARGNLTTTTGTTLTNGTVGTTTTLATVATPAITPASEITAPPGDLPTSGRILYSALDLTTGRSRVMVQPADGSTASMLRDAAAQPALRSDGQRLIFHNELSDMAGLSAFDPANGLLLRFTEYAEDSLPSWSAEGNRIVFASNREGDRIWRIYAMWAEDHGEVTNLGFGQSPDWHPLADQIVFRGCDASGNGCGLWTMSASGSSRAPLTTVPSDDRPTWSPDGSSVVFMSNERHGNPEIYRMDVGSGAVTRLTDSPAIDGLPVVSPDGAWVAFVSNRDGAWKLWAMPIAGGPAGILAPINGDLGDWLAQDLQWVN